MKKRGIEKRVTGGKIKEAFEIKADEYGNKVVTGHRNFGNERRKCKTSRRDK